jgi:hypothetical protein
MRSFLTLAFIATIFGTAFAADVAGNTSVPRGTVVPVLLAQELRQGGMSAGSVGSSSNLHLTVAQDVIVKNQVIVKAGDPVDAAFTSAMNVNPGITMHAVNTITVSVQDAVNFCGYSLHLYGQFSAQGSVKSGMFGAKVKDAVIPKGTVFLASTDRVEPKVCSAKTTAAPAPVPANAMTPSAL